MKTSRFILVAAFLLAGEVSLLADSEPRPAATVDLKAAGMAADLFANPPENRQQSRGLFNFFWISGDQLVTAFSTTPRYTKEKQPQPLQIRMAVFDGEGKQINTHDWSFGATGPEANESLDLEPGPDHSILAVHVSGNDEGQVPEGNQVQVLGADGKPVENFYLPSNSVLLPASSGSSSLAVQQFIAGGRTALHFYTGHPLKSGLNLQFDGQKETLAGDNEAARLVCSAASVCPVLRVVKSDGTAWNYTEKPPLTPHPRAFLNPDTLLVEVSAPDKPGQLVVVRSDGSRIELPPLKHDEVLAGVAGVAGSRFAIDTFQQSSACGFLEIVCTHHAAALVYEVAGKESKVIFEKSLSLDNGRSALSPDGKRLAVLDRGKLAIYALP